METDKYSGQCRQYKLAHATEFIVLNLPGKVVSCLALLAGLFNAQYMTRMARIALMPPKAMRCRPSETLRTPLKRRMLVANERRRAKMPGLQRMRLSSSAKLPSRT